MNIYILVFEEEPAWKIDIAIPEDRKQGTFCFTKMKSIIVQAN